MTDREDFEKWICGYVKQEHKNLNKFMYKLLTVKAAWQEQQKKIDALEAEIERLKELLQLYRENDRIAGAME